LTFRQWWWCGVGRPEMGGGWVVTNGVRRQLEPRPAKIDPNRTWQKILGSEHDSLGPNPK